mmetsp:Transcript_5733/g.17074  ORF Transcript_5733/g.17074 Transcript_5733/m.17074 type:complete len:240 (+) Transcript_5733:31-750(+)
MSISLLATMRICTNLAFVSTLFFDCDDTLYPRSSGIDLLVRENIGKYMEQHLGIPKERVSHLRQDLYEKFGTTLRGLQKEYNVDADHYWDFVHGTIDYDSHIEPNPRLAKLLKSLPQKKWVFTNANVEHAEAVLNRLGLSDGIFEGIVDVRAMDFANKPQLVSYQVALKTAGVQNPHETALIDDSLSNLEGAKNIGMKTVHVAPAPKNSVAHTAHLNSLEEMPEKLSGLWNFSPEKVLV